MSKRVYLSKNPYQTIQEEKTPVSIRIQASHATVKALGYPSKPGQIVADHVL
jgi:hypothetical protein